MWKEWIKTLNFVAILFFVMGCGSTELVTPTIEKGFYTPAVLVTKQTTQISPISPVVIQPHTNTPVVPKPQYGQATVYGKLVSMMTQIPIAETAVYLTPGIGEHNDLLPPVLVGPQENDILAFTDKQGDYIFSDVSPGIYYLVIWSPVNWVPLSDAIGSGKPLQLVLEENQVLDLGTIIVDWP